MKIAATELGLAVHQPSSNQELADILSRHEIDVGVVVAFGMILSPTVLELPRRGFVNVHFSLLPRWRGAAPVERAIMAGDEETGVTIMAMDAGLDTGPIIARRAYPIGTSTTGGELRQALASEGAALLSEVLPAWVSGEIEATPQPAEGVTYASRLTSADRVLDFGMPTREVQDRVRALAPAPGARLPIDGEMHKVYATRRSHLSVGPGEWAEEDGFPTVGFADGALTVLRLQPPGKQPMDGDAWLRGRRLPTAPA